MATADIVTTLGVDMGDALKRIDQLSKTVEKLQARLSTKTSVKVDTKDAESRFQRATRLANTAVDKNKKALQELALQGKQGSQAWNDAVAKMEKAVQAQRGVAKASKSAEDAIKGINSKLDQAGQKTSKLRSLMGKAGDVAKSAFGGGLLGGLLGGGVAGLVTQGVSVLTQKVSQAFDEYKLLNTNLQNVGTLGVQEESLQRFQDLVGELSTTVPDKASDIMNGVYQSISAGVTGTEEEIVDYVKTASQVAVAGLATTEEAVNGLSTITNAYGLGAQGATFAADSMFAAIKAGKTTFNEMNQAMAQVVPTAAAAGIKFDDVAGQLAYLTANGIPTRQASTALNASFNALLKPTKDLEKVLKAAGLDTSKMGEYLKDTSEGGLGYVGVLKKMKEGLDKTGESVATSVSSVQAKKAFNTFFTNLDRMEEKVQEVRDSVAAGGVAQGAYDAAAKGIQVQLDVLRNKIQFGFTKIFQTVVPIFAKAFSFLSDVVGPIMAETFAVISDTWDSVKDIIMPVLAIVGGAILGTFVTGIKIGQATLQALLRIATKVFTRIKEAIQPLLDKIFGVNDGVESNVDAFAMFQQVIEETFGVIDDFVDIIVELGGLLVEIVVTAIELVVKAITTLVGWFSSSNDEMDKTKKKTKEAGDGFNDFKKVLFNIKGTLGGVTKAFQAIKVAIEKFVDTLFSKNFLDVISGDFWKGIGSDIGDAYNKGFNEATAEMEETAESTGKKIEGTAQVKTEIDNEGLDEGIDDADKKTKTAFEKASKAWKEYDDERKSLLTQEINRINAMEELSQEFRDELIRQATEQSLKNAQTQYDKVFKVVRDESGNLLKTSLKATGDETQKVLETTIRNGVNNLNAEQLKVKIQPIVGKNLLFDGEVEFAGDLFDSNLERDMNASMLDIFANLKLPSVNTGAVVNAFSDSLSALPKAIADAFASGAGNEEQLKREESALNESLKKREISYVEYQAKLGELSDKLDLTSPFTRMVEGIQAASVQAFDAVRQALTPAIDQIAKGIGEKTHSIDDAFGVMAIGVGASFAQMAASGEISLKGMLLSMLDALSAMVPIIVAQLFGLYSASPNPVNIFGLGVPGIAAAGAVGATFTALVQIARGVVSNAFAGGVVGLSRGKAPKGTDTIPASTTWGSRVLLDEGESVLTRKATRRGRNAELFTWLNATGGDAMDWLMSQKVTRSDLNAGLNLHALGITFSNLVQQGAMIAHEASERDSRGVVRTNRELVKRMEELTEEVRLMRTQETRSKQAVEVVPVIKDRALIDRIETKRIEHSRGW